ncbi:hypothetical protein RQP46_004651 [Phenoliferia psychrophenolica]
MTDYKFSGWGAFDKNSVKGELRKFDYTPKKWDETDVDIKIQYAGICASDLHTIREGWGKVVGHEIVGVVVRVGSKVTHVKVGDIAGVGAQNDSCGTCTYCEQHREPYCDGGYANYHRAPGNFVMKVPAGLDPAFAAPLMCGGVTVYSPLKQYGAGTTAKDVGIVGIGGLGHFGLLFAKALGANVTAISHSESKKADALKMGATRFIATHSGGDDDFKPYKRSLDLIVCTTNDVNMPLLGYLSLLKPGGNLILVGAPEEPLPSFPAFPLIMNNVHIGGSAIGAPSVIKEMLELAAKENVQPWIVKRPLDDVNQAVRDMEASKARYRYVLVNTENGGQL